MPNTQTERVHTHHNLHIFHMRESNWVARTLNLFVGTSDALSEVITLTAIILIKRDELCFGSCVCLVGGRCLLGWSFPRLGW